MEAGAALVGALIDAGVDTAFTVPGESFLAVLEALRVNRNRVRLVSVRQVTGGTMAAAVALFRKVGAEVVGGACVMELNFLNGRDNLDIPFTSLIDYDE